MDLGPLKSTKERKPQCTDSLDVVHIFGADGRNHNGLGIPPETLLQKPCQLRITIRNVLFLARFHVCQFGNDISKRREGLVDIHGLRPAKQAVVTQGTIAFDSRTGGGGKSFVNCRIIPPSR